MAPCVSYETLSSFDAEKGWMKGPTVSGSGSGVSFDPREEQGSEGRGGLVITPAAAIVAGL